MKSEFGAVELDGGPWCRFKNPKTGRDIVVKDVIADAFLQQILLRPKDYAVIATLNLNGDYISDALAAQVGMIKEIEWGVSGRPPAVARRRFYTRPGGWGERRRATVHRATG